MLRLGWFGLAEGAAGDHRGQLTLVGFNINVVPIPEAALPATLSIVLVAVIEADMPADLTAAGKIQLSSHFSAPDETVMFAGQQSLDVPPLPWPEVPPRIQLVVAGQATFQRYGLYTARVRIDIPGHEPLLGDRGLWVLAPPH